MEFTEESLSKILLNRLNESDHYKTVIEIVKKNCLGKIYLIGGTVSRTLASAIYGVKQDFQDFDFVVDKLNKNLAAPKGWDISYHKFGNPTFKKDEIEVDIFPFSDYAYIKENNKEPTIMSFLEGVPFTIQSLAFDVDKGILIGEVGIEALREKKFGVHNLDSAKEVTRVKGVSINERMMQKAKSMDFEIIPYSEKG